MASQTFWEHFYWWPIRRTHQLLFAEAFSQALDAGLEISMAVRVAAAAMPGPRFRYALQQMAVNCRIGYTLEQSLRRTRVRGCNKLLSTLSVGEELGDLSGGLAALARSGGWHPGSRLAAVVGRRPETIRFAAALARLLRDRRLTVSLVEDAALMAAGEGSAFVKAVGRVVEDMRCGVTFSESLFHVPRFFDPLFCFLVGGPTERQRLRAVLM